MLLKNATPPNFLISLALNKETRDNVSLLWRWSSRRASASPLSAFFTSASKEVYLSSPSKRPDSVIKRAI